MVRRPFGTMNNIHPQKIMNEFFYSFVCSFVRGSSIQRLCVAVDNGAWFVSFCFTESCWLLRNFAGAVLECTEELESEAVEATPTPLQSASTISQLSEACCFLIFIDAVCVDIKEFRPVLFSSSASCVGTRWEMAVVAIPSSVHSILRGDMSWWCF